MTLDEFYLAEPIVAKIQDLTKIKQQIEEFNATYSGCNTLCLQDVKVGTVMCDVVTPLMSITLSEFASTFIPHELPHMPQACINKLDQELRDVQTIGNGSFEIGKTQKGSAAWAYK